MAFNGSGVYNLVMDWVADAASGIKIRADRHMTQDQDFANALSNTICRDGQSTVIANLPMNAKRITGLGDPVNPQDAVTQKWVGDNVTGGALIADAPPAAGKVGNLWWDSDQGGLFLRYDDGSSVQWVQVNVAPPLGAEPQDDQTYARKNGVWVPYISASPNIPLLVISRDIAVPSFNVLEVSLAACVNSVASQFVYMQLLTGGTGTPWGDLTGGANLVGGAYAGALSVVTSGVSTGAWTTNVPLAGAAAVNSNHGGRIIIRNNGNGLYQIDSAVAYVAGSGNCFSTGYANAGGPITGIRLGLTPPTGGFNSGSCRLFAL